MTITITAVGKTHVGLVRKRNEDSFYVGSSLVAIADGMGGHPAGDVASQTAIEAIRAFDQPTEPQNLPDALGRAVRAANDAMGRRIAADPDVRGMGTTLVAVMWSGTTAALANVGDSRAYLYRTDTGMVPLTEDHTYAHLVADAADVPRLPERLARWLDGRPDSRSPDITTRKLQLGDRILVCSDGLSSFVSHEAIKNTMEGESEQAATADRLIDLANEAGGRDNVTVIVIAVLPE
jgi:serine/threonine protein phosphatase PrpC